MHRRPCRSAGTAYNTVWYRVTQILSIITRLCLTTSKNVTKSDVCIHRQVRAITNNCFERSLKFELFSNMTDGFIGPHLAA